MLKLPLLSVVVERLKALTGLCISTVAFGTTAPEGSKTVPVTDVEFPPDCAYAVRPSTMQKRIVEAANSDFLQKASMIPPEGFV
jgi:hypothetical protein